MMTMSWQALIVLVVIAAVCGAIGRALAGGSRGGLVTSIALGFIGAQLGTWMARQFRLPEPLVVHLAGRAFPIIWPIIGAALVVAILHLLTRPRSLVRV